MQKYRHILRRRATLNFIDCLVIVIFLTVWIVRSEQVPTGRSIPYIKASDHILVQLAKLPELTGTEMHNVPMWTLYGNGTLIFRTDPSDNLWRAQLSPGEIQHILDVVINQNTFFENITQQDGSITSDKDDDRLLLTVNANGQQKEVILMKEPTNKVDIDIQTSHVFAIEQFLLAYHPLHSVFYAPDPNSDHDSDDVH
jgi:hypothetical protein